MAGKNGFTHYCTSVKINKLQYRCSVRNAGFSGDVCSLLWDFYVTRSFASKTGMRITLDEYGWNETTSRTNGLRALENALARNASIAEFGIIRAKTIKDTLSAMDLSNEMICTVHPRAVLIQNYSCDLNENEMVSIKSRESRINAIFRHVRNAFAHGNTYFFDNGMCLLEDKDGASITAAILIPKQSLLDWTRIVDKNGVLLQRAN